MSLKTESLPNDVSRVVGLYRQMAEIRAFETVAAHAWTAGEVRGSVHQYIGQEAIAVGVCANLKLPDYVASNHRNHGHNIAKGADCRRMVLELFGRAEGTCGGKGGSLHIADFSRGIIGANGVVGDGVSIAVGVAHSVKLMKDDRIVVVFFGDGAINRGPVMEALNWAKVFALPVLFVCEDNGYAATTDTKTVTAGHFPVRVAGFGITGLEVDGNDLMAVDAAAEQLVCQIRARNGPAFLYAKTYRQKGHFFHDKATYRDQTAHEAAMKLDPMLRTAGWLEERGVSAAELAAIETEEMDRMIAFADEARVADWPDAQQAFTSVQTLGAPL